MTVVYIYIMYEVLVTLTKCLLILALTKILVINTKFIVNVTKKYFVLRFLL